MQRLLLGNKDISTSLKFDNEFSVVAFPIYEDSIELEYLVVGGGGGGGSAHNLTKFAGGGGGAGQVVTGSLTFATGSADMPVYVGLAGKGANYPGDNPNSAGRGGNGYNSFLGNIIAISGSGGHPIGDSIRFDETGGPSGAGFRGGYNDIFDHAAGGGAGNTSAGVDGDDAQPDDPNVAIGGNGGTGTNLNDWYLNSSLDVVGIVAGGGGGSAYSSVNLTAGVGSAGGGNAGLNTNNATDATSFGSGGGGAFKAFAGDGGGGLVILRYKNRFKINNSGDEVFQVGNYWYHVFDTPSLSSYTFERPDKILVSV